jgi:hypothetical protein
MELVLKNGKTVNAKETSPFIRLTPEQQVEIVQAVEEANAILLEMVMQRKIAAR